ncbi:helix-turn-helix transcriptional regulator [Atopobiaceae bacterium 24-176]
MARPRFSDFLSNRRRQLGLTIPQASRVLRLKEQVLLAFEEGDWERIPRSGYAQGMLSSYARYLGLNPREVIDLFQEDLQAYADGQGASASHRQSRPTDDPSRGQGRQGVVVPSKDNDLYGSAGPAGSILSGTLVGSSYLHSAEEHRGASSPLVNGRSAGYSERYLRQNGYATPGAEGGSLPPAGGTTEPRDYPQGRPYTARAPLSSRARRGVQGRAAASDRAGRTRSNRARQDARRYASTDIQTRDVSSTMYDDDLRYGLAADTYRQASSAEVRETARSSVAAPQRPNVRRRPSTADRYRPNQRNAKPPRSGVLGVLDAWFSDPRRTMLTVFVALAVALILVIVLSVRSCSAPAPEGGNRAQIPVTQSSSDNSGNSDKAGDTTTQSSAAQTPAASASDAAADANKPVEVEVSVPDGAAVWVEVKNGDKNEVAQTVTGPWNQKFTVNGELEVRTADPAQVTVTANGQPVSFDTSAAGIGTATVKGPSTEPSANDAAASSNSKTSDGQDQDGANASTSVGTGTASSSTQSRSSSSAASDGIGSGTSN